MSAIPCPATFSKSPLFWGKDFEPQAIKAGHGARVLSADGKAYIDWVSSLGANLLGHCNSGFNERLHWQIMDGAAFTLPHFLEERVAERLIAMLGEHVPDWKREQLQVRWVLGGSEGCAAAVTLARAATKRQWALSIGYHGWHPMFTGLTPPAYGVVPDPYMVDVPFNDLGALELHLHEHGKPAAVIVEQPATEPAKNYWQNVRTLCIEYGALLILDEVVTGFRIALGGWAEYSGIQPDIAVYGKAISNGLPLGAVVAPREYMHLFEPPEPVFVSATGAANPLSLAAAEYVLSTWNEGKLAHLWRIGEGLMGGLREAGYSVIGQPPRSLLQFQSKAERGYFVKGMAARGILCNRPNIPNWSHSQKDVCKTIAAAREVKAEMERVDVEELMKDKLPMVLFENR